MAEKTLAKATGIEAQIQGHLRVMKAGPTPDDRWRAVEAVAKLGKPAVPALLRAFNSGDHDLRVGAEEALKRIAGGAYFHTSLSGLLKDGSPSVRKEAAIALGKLAEEKWKSGVLGRVEYRSAIPHLVASLKDGDAGVRAEAAKSLGAFKASQAEPELRRVASTDPDLRAKRSAEAALAELSKMPKPASIVPRRA